MGPRIPEGGVPLVPLWQGIGKKRFGSIGDWPCLAVITDGVVLEEAGVRKGS